MLLLQVTVTSNLPDDRIDAQGGYLIRKIVFGSIKSNTRRISSHLAPLLVESINLEVIDGFKLKTLSIPLRTLSISETNRPIKSAVGRLSKKGE